MDQTEFKRRTRDVAVAAILLAEDLPTRRAADILARQLIRSATSIGANYRAACRARSPQEMFAKLWIVEEETDETLYWLEMLAAPNIIGADRTEALRREVSEVLAMTVESKKTLRSRISNSRSRIVNRQSSIDNRDQ